MMDFREQLLKSQLSYDVDNVMASNFSDYISNTTHNTLKDFLEYQISLKIHLYYFPVVVSIGLPGNVISFIVLSFTSFRKSTISVYLAVISFLDTMILSVSLVWYINRKMPEAHIFDDVSCKIINFLFYFSIHFDVILIIAVTVERFIVVVFPLKAQGWVTMKRAVTVIVCCGLFSASLNSHFFFSKRALISKSTGATYCGTVRAAQFFIYKIYPWIDSMIYCVIPMTSLFVLNIIMLRHMKSSLRRRQSMSSQASESSSSQRQMTVMLLMVSFFFLFLTGPMGIILIVERYVWISKSDKDKAISRLIHSITDNMVYTNHAVNFIFYCFSGQKFRNELKGIFFICCRAFMKKKPASNRGLANKRCTSVSTEFSVL